MGRQKTLPVQHRAGEYTFGWQESRDSWLSLSPYILHDGTSDLNRLAKTKDAYNQRKINEGAESARQDDAHRA
jgi:hypothetical protein